MWPVWLAVAVVAIVVASLLDARAGDPTPRISKRQLRRLLRDTEFDCVRDDCRVALGLQPPRQHQTREQARERCAEELQILQRAAVS